MGRLLLVGVGRIRLRDLGRLEVLKLQCCCELNPFGAAHSSQKTKLEDEKVVKEWRAKAEVGDGYAMLRLGARYAGEDDVQSRAWFERSAATRNPPGMAMFGECLLRGIGGPKDNVLGLVNATEAAHLGSNLGAYRLGWAFFEGGHGLSKDPVRARYWLKKVVDGECTFKHLTDPAIADAAIWLRELDQ